MLEDHDFTIGKIGTATHPAAHELLAPFATVNDPTGAEDTTGCEVHRVAVDAVFAGYTLTGFAVHEYDQFSNRFRYADCAYEPCEPALNTFGKFRYDRATVLPPLNVPAFRSTLADWSVVVPVCTNVSNVVVARFVA